MLSDSKLAFGYAASIVFLLWGTGVFSDDLNALVEVSGHGNWWQALTPKGIVLTLPVQQLTHYWLFTIATYENLWPILMAKTFYIVLAWWCVGRFLSLFMPLRTAWFASMLFLFLPMHDSTTYWFLAQHITLSIAMYCLAYRLAMADVNDGATEATGGIASADALSQDGTRERRRTRMRLRALTGSFLCAMAGSFVSYGSPPVAFAMFVLAGLHGRWGRGLVLWSPNLLYIAYYLYQTTVTGAATGRIPTAIGLGSLSKQMVLQIATMLDATVGPSAWLKVGLGCLCMGWCEWMLLGMLVAFLSYCRSAGRQAEFLPKASINWRLAAGLGVLAISAAGMFAVTGAYPQLAFNLGNRATTYACLCLAYLLVVGAQAPMVRNALVIAAAAAALGTSAHWRSWHAHQATVVHAMRRNADLVALPPGVTIWVCGNQYSQLGPFSHIEFMSEHWVPDSCLKLAGHIGCSGLAMNRRFVVQGPVAVDEKYGRRTPLDTEVVVYDSDQDTVAIRTPSEFAAAITELPPNRRHWIEFEAAAFARRAAIRLMPRLEYALGDK
jgi:hypothetical protein